VQFEGDDVERTELTEAVAAAYAKLAAEAFGVGESCEVEFDQKTAEKWLKLEKKQQDKLRRDKPMTQQFTDAPTESAETPAGKPKRPDRGTK
jgi:hypothetical protein